MAFVLGLPSDGFVCPIVNIFIASHICYMLCVVCCVLKYMSLMAELGQGPPPSSNVSSKGKSSFSPALPMLGASTPVLALPPPSVSLLRSSN